MNYRDLFLARIAYLHAELTGLAALIRLDTTTTAAPAPVVVAQPPQVTAPVQAPAAALPVSPPVSAPSVAPKRRGRPPSTRNAPTDAPVASSDPAVAASHAELAAAAPAILAAPKRRGRPPGSRNAPKTAPSAVAARPPAAPTKRMEASAPGSDSDSAAYRLIGENPFRAGSETHALYEHLRSVYGSGVFTRPQFSKSIEALRNDDVITGTLAEGAMVRQFVKRASHRGALQIATVEQVPEKVTRKRPSEIARPQPTPAVTVNVKRMA